MKQKILYGINTNGQGHINRSRTIIKQLQSDGNHVDVVFSGPRPPPYAKKLAHRYRLVDGWEVLYEQNRLDIIATFFRNISTFVNLPAKLRQFLKIFHQEDYDLVITDFDLFSSVSGKLTDTPTISIDHQHSLLHPNAILPPGNSTEKWATINAVYSTTPYRNYYLAIDYVDKISSNSSGALVPLVWKDELDDYSVTRDDHIVVYLSKYPEDKIIKFFNKFGDYHFKVYGYNRSASIDNVELCKTSRDGFLSDLTSSRAVIAHSGFSLTWETTLLGKPLWAIPQQFQYEQITNAYRLDQLGFAYTSDKLSKTGFDEFVNYMNTTNIARSKSYLTTREFVNHIYTVYNQIIRLNY